MPPQLHSRRIPALFSCQTQVRHAVARCCSHARPIASRVQTRSTVAMSAEPVHPPCATSAASVAPACPWLPLLMANSQQTVLRARGIYGSRTCAAGQVGRRHRRGEERVHAFLSGAYRAPLSPTPRLRRRSRRASDKILKTAPRAATPRRTSRPSSPRRRSTTSTTPSSRLEPQAAPQPGRPPPTQ